MSIDQHSHKAGYPSRDADAFKRGAKSVVDNMKIDKMPAATVAAVGSSGALVDSLRQKYSEEFPNPLATEQTSMFQVIISP
jgi:hypothetical protein